jgi:hypothetical protein
MKLTRSSKTDEALEQLRAMLAHPAPRPVPVRIWKFSLNPIALLLIFLGLIFLGVQAPIFIIKFKDFPWINALIIYFPLACGLVWGLYSIYKTKVILAWGQVYEGAITRIRSLPARMGARSYYLVTVKFTDGKGVERTAKDVVDNFSVQYFFDALNADNKTELIFTPRASRSVRLAMRIAVKACLG